MSVGGEGVGQLCFHWIKCIGGIGTHVYASIALSVLEGWDCNTSIALIVWESWDYCAYNTCRTRFELLYLFYCKFMGGVGTTLLVLQYVRGSGW